MKLFTKDIDKKLFAQFPKGGELANQKVIAKIFNPYGRGIWYIINSDPNDPDYLWAIVNLFEVEVGSVSRKELESLKIKPFMLPLERDLSFSERNALEVYEGALKGQRFEDGGETNNKRTLKLSDAVLYRGETFYLTKRNDEVGLVSYTQGAWGNGGRFLPLGKMYRSDLEENLTDMYGNKVNIPSYDDLMKQTYGFMEHGGEMDDEEGVDLFEDYEDQPEEVSELLETLDVEDYNYDSLNDLLSEMKKIGYTFEFGLDAEPYDLRKIGQKGKSEFYAKGGEVAKVGEPYDSMTKYRLEKEWNKLNEKRDLLKRKYGSFESEDIIENEKEIDKIITLLYGENFSGVGQKFKYAEGGQLGTINTELINVKNNIMGTTTLEMKIKGMRKPQNFIVYPISAEQANKPIMIQSDTRFGFLDLSTGEGLMSQSHANGAYSYHFQTDKKVHFKLSETDVQKIKSDLSKKAGSKVGNSVIFSDNSGANMMAKGGAIENQYEGRTPKDIWNNLSKSQRGHFLYDHEQEIANYKGIGELSSLEIRDAYNSDWADLDEDIKNRFDNHTRVGQYAEGGKVDESTKMVLSQNKAIAHHTEELKRALKKDPNVEPWVIGKVGRAETDISDVTHYLDGRSEYARGGVMRKRKMTLYESKLMAENGKRVLVSHDAQQFYTIEDGVLYKTDDDLNHQEKFDMDKIDLTIKPMESYGGKYARGGKTKLMLNYVSPRDISLLKITTDDGVKHSIKGESIISGEYKLARGGKLSDNYVYIPKRNIDQVILKDGKTTDDKFNGFYVKKESLKSVESYSSEEGDAVAQMKNAIAKVKSNKTLKALEIADAIELSNTFAFQDAVEKAIKENKKSEAIDVYAEAITVLNKKYKFLIAKDLPEFGNPNAINLFPSKYIDVPSLKLKTISKKSNIENDDSWLKQINKFTSNDGEYRPAMTAIRFEGNSVVATNGTMLIHIYNNTKVETKEICVSNICKKFGGDKTSEDKTKSKYPQWSDIVISSFDRLENCEIDVNNFLKLAEFSVNQFTLSKDVNIPRIAIKTKNRNMIFNSELIITTMTTLKLLGLSKCKIHYDEIKRNSGVYFTTLDATFDPLKNDFVLTMPMMNQETQQFGIDCETGKYVIVGVRYAKGGVTFDDKVKSVENNLFGKEVPKKYRNSYGKTYNKAEAHESAQKIIGAQVKKYNKK